MRAITEIACICLVASASGDAPSALPDGVVGRLNGEPILLEHYQHFLLVKVGPSLLGEYVDQVLVDQEASRLGISIPYEVLAKETAKEVEEEMRPLRGIPPERLAALQVIPREEREKRVRSRVLRRLILDQCVRADRRAPGKDPGLEASPAPDEGPPTPDERNAYLEGLRRKGDIRIAGRAASAPRTGK